MISNIRTEDDYVSIVQAIFFCTKNVYMKNEEEEQRDEEEKVRIMSRIELRDCTLRPTPQLREIVFPLEY